MFFLNQVIASSESNKMGIVGRCRNGNGTSTADVSVAELIGETLQLVGVEVIVVPENMVMAWTARTLNALMWAQVKIKFGWVGNASIDSCASRYVARFARLLFLVSAKESRVVALLHNDKRDTRFVIRF